MHHIIVDPDDRILNDPQRTWALLRLCLQADDNGNVFCSLQQLATGWGVSRYTVLRVTRELEAGGVGADRATSRTYDGLSCNGTRDATSGKFATGSKFATSLRQYGLR